MRRGRRSTWALPGLERLEARTLLAGHSLATATLLTFQSPQTVEASGFLSARDQVDLYKVHLGPGDEVRALVSVQARGSALQPVLRVFALDGRQVALNNQAGGDPSLTFQAPTAGDYFLGVSSAGNADYDPITSGSAVPGETTGLYALQLRREPAQPLQPDLTGGSFRLGARTAVWGEEVPVSFVIDNRGGAASGAFQVQFLLSRGNLLGPDAVPLGSPLAFSALAAGGQVASQANLRVTLPGSPPAGFSSGEFRLGLRILPITPPEESNTLNNGDGQRGTDWETLTILTAVTPDGANTSLATAQTLADVNSRVPDELTAPGQEKWYRLDLLGGRLTAEALAVGTGAAGLRLRLLGPDGQVLAEAVAGASGQPAARIEQHLEPGTYYLVVSARSLGLFRLESQVVQASPPFAPLAFGSFSRPSAAGLADVNGDGRPDIVATRFNNASVSVLLGNSDGSFSAGGDFATGSRPIALALADVNGDGSPDIVTANRYSYDVSVLLGNGDGSFSAHTEFAIGGSPSAVALADVNGDGRPDIVTSNHFSNSVSVLLGNGDGSFSAHTDFTTGSFPTAVAVGDVNGDGKPDIVTSNRISNDVSVLLGNGNGSFGTRTDFTTGSSPYSVAVADVNGDGRPDIVSANHGTFPLFRDSVSVLLGNGDGSFAAPRDFALGSLPTAVVVADANGDGRLDIVSANRDSDSVSVLLGNGDGSFSTRRDFATGSRPYTVALADVSGDGRPDIVTANFLGDSVSVLLGNGDGSFAADRDFTTGRRPIALAVADVNRDGKLDIVSANRTSNSVSVLLGNGDGTFAAPRDFTTDSRPSAVAVADVNGDGRPDIVVTKFNSASVSVLLGNGDGSFAAGTDFATGFNPTAVAVGDVNGDGRHDIVTANYGSNSVSVLLGNGDGSFATRTDFFTGFRPSAVALVNVNGDGNLDIVSGNRGSSSASVLLGNGDGTFAARTDFATGLRPYTVAVADVSGDGRPDIVSANFLRNSVSVMLGNSDGSFSAPRDFVTGSGPYGVAVADVNGDGKSDIVTSNRTGDGVSVLVGNGDGTFSPRTDFATRSSPITVALADVNGDGRPDIVTANSYSDNVSVLLGAGDGASGLPAFTTSTPLREISPRNTPHQIDLDSDGRPDTVILDRSGDILFRKGSSDVTQPFAAPITLNSMAAIREDRPARDIVPLRLGSGWAIAAIDAQPDVSNPARPVYTISLYTLGPAGPIRPFAFTTTVLPMRIAAGDLSATGRDDLVLLDSLDNSVTLVRQISPGRFAPEADRITRAVGVNPSEVLLTDVDGDSLLDVVVSSSISGDVTVLYNDAAHSFVRTSRVRGGLGPFASDSSSGSATILSLNQPVALAAGRFTSDGHADLVVLNRGAHSFSVLVNDGLGSYFDPTGSLTTSTSEGLTINDRPGATLAADLDSDGNLDLVVLMEDRAEVWVFAGNGDGTFRHTSTAFAGTTPTGMTLVDNADSGQLDLLVGNPFGDILRLAGQGNGTFRTAPPFAGNRTTLSVLGRDGNDRPRVLVGNQQTNQVKVQVPTGTGQFGAVATLADGDSPLPLAPGSVLWVKLDGPNDLFFDAVVVGSGNNSVLVYHDAEANPGVEPTSYTVGTNPVHVTVGFLDLDSVPDLVVTNNGSNDVSVLVGQLDGSGDWTTLGGPRVGTGGVGPIATSLRDTNGDGRLDLMVTNSQDQPNSVTGSVVGMPARGQGFFDDRTLIPTIMPGTPSGGLVFTGSIGVLPTNDGRLLGFDPGTFTSLGVVFTGPAVNAVIAFEGGLVVAFDNRGVAILEPAGDQFTISAELDNQTGQLPSEPSALEVLLDVDGFLSMVLLTVVGSDQLFVFGPESSEPLSSQQAPTTSVVLEATEVEGAPLAVVVTLLAGALAEDEATLTSAEEQRPGLQTRRDEAGFQVSGDGVEELGTEQAEEAVGETPPEGVDAAEAAQDLLPARPREEDPFREMPGAVEAEGDEGEADEGEVGVADADEVFAQAMRQLRRQGSEVAGAPGDSPWPGEWVVNLRARGPMALADEDALPVERDDEDPGLGFLAVLGLAWWSGCPSLRRTRCVRASSGRATREV